jgi:hypothetical protein
MADEWSTEDVKSRCEKEANIDNVLLQNGVSFGTIRTVRFFDWKQSFVKTAKALDTDDLSINNSQFFNRFDNVYRVNQIPHISIDDGGEIGRNKLGNIFNYFTYFKFGNVPFICSHDIDDGAAIFPGTQTVKDKDIFEMRYGIKLEGVYISLNELQDVADYSGIVSEIDDFFVVGNYDNTVLTIIDNDLDYSARESIEKYKCNFKPVFVLDRGIPVKYIKVVDDNKPFYNKYVPERRLEYNLQRKQHLKKLNDVFKHPDKQDNFISGYPADIDFVVKTGLRQFSLLSYDRFSNTGDFWITNVRYNNDGRDPEFIIKKCNFWNLQQNIKAIQRARANHFNKMYAAKEK